MTTNGSSRPSFYFDRYELRPNERLLSRDGSYLHLTPRVFDLLEVLVRNAGTVVTKEELLDEVWTGTIVEEGNINRTISTLRRQLGRQENGKDFIETVPKVGYRFVSPVRQDEGTEPAATEAPAGTSDGAVVPNGPTTETRSGWPIWLAAAAVLAAIVIAYVWWRTSSTAPAGKPQPVVADVRLTNSPENEQVAGWTNDGRIIITRWTSPTTPETYVIGHDGSGLEKATSIADVRQAIWSPDGSRMISWRYSDAGASAYLSAADGSDSRKLPFSVGNAAWAPDSSKFAFQTAANGTKKLNSTEILVYSVKDEKTTELTSNSSFDGDPGWSPDGRTIVFSSDRDGNYEIYSMLSDGSNVRRLTNNPGHDSFPKFSPDGTQIVFNSNIERETTDIYIMNTDGSHTVRLTDSKGNELTRNGWSPDGTKLAYNSDIDGNDEIYLMDVDPFKPTLLIEDENAEVQTPSYSPGGRQIVYTAQFADKHSEIRIFDKDSGHSKVVASTSSPQNYPRWSPDGQWIAFHQEVAGKWDVFKVRPDGSDLTDLTNDPSSDSIPTWSADSSTIYFRSNRNGDTENSELFRMNADGSGQTVLPVKKGKLGWGSISPKGNEIAFAADREGGAAEQFDIFAADPISGTERLIASRPNNDIQSTFSNDGSRIAFVSLSDGNPEIYIVNTDGSAMLRMTRNVASDANPVFSFDGSSLLFTSNRSGRYAIYELSLDQASGARDDRKFGFHRFDRDLACYLFGNTAKGFGLGRIG